MASKKEKELINEFLLNVVLESCKTSNRIVELDENGNPISDGTETTSSINSVDDNQPGTSKKSEEDNQQETSTVSCVAPQEHFAAFKEAIQYFAINETLYVAHNNKILSFEGFFSEDLRPFQKELNIILQQISQTRDAQEHNSEEHPFPNNIDVANNNVVDIPNSHIPAEISDYSIDFDKAIRRLLQLNGNEHVLFSARPIEHIAQNQTGVEDDRTINTEELFTDENGSTVNDDDDKENISPEFDPNYHPDLRLRNSYVYHAAMYYERCFGYFVMIILCLFVFFLWYVVIFENKNVISKEIKEINNTNRSVMPTQLLKNLTSEVNDTINSDNDTATSGAVDNTSEALLRFQMEKPVPAWKPFFVILLMIIYIFFWFL